MKRPTYQSSRYQTWSLDDKSLASVDGKYKKCQDENFISMTNVGMRQWWKVILDEVYEIDSVILYNQVDNYYSEQLSNVDIYVYDFGGKRSLCANTGNMKNVYIKEFKCKAGAIGNVVMLSKSDEGSIRLCEVVVYGDKGKFTY